MSVKQNYRNLLLVTTACAFFAACADSSISSPGSANLGTPPGGGGGSTPPATTTIDLVPAGGCGTGSIREASITNNNVTINACEITGTISSDTTIAAGAGVIITGPTFVGTDGGSPVNLTINEGATLFGSAGSDYIVVARGSEMNAVGTASDPIIFTSRTDVEGNAGPNDKGQWGGLVINGFAPINACTDGAATGGTAGCTKSGEGSSGLFGGDNPADSSGELRYVQVRFAGFLVNNEDELNGIAFQGVGSGTDVNFIQVHNNADDGIEMFGGTVDMKYIVLTGNDDDSMDYTDGWQGRAQFVLVDQGPSGDQGFEFDNFEDNDDRLPRSAPIISNFTLLGNRNGTGSNDSDQGMLLREGTAGLLYNGIVADFGDDCFDVDDDSTFARFNGTGAAGDELLAMQSVVLDCPNNFDESSGDPADLSTWFLGQANNAEITNTLSGPFSGPVEQAVTAFDINASDAWFTDVDYIGAFEDDDTAASNWAAGWTFNLFPDPGCPTGTTESAEVINGMRVCQLTGTLINDVRLDRNSMYELIGPVFVGRDSGGDPANPLASATPVSLTIDPGVTVFGSAGSDYIVVTRGSELNANGTATSPVVFTARDGVEGTAGINTKGQWGGLVINGRAPINACTDGGATGGTVGCEKTGEGSSGLFGGASVSDDSGDITYTQVLYAGFLVNAEDELNGIAFQGVGNGGTVDYVQVHNNADDGIEMFGGTVDLRHLVLTGNDDDSLDYTDGWQGRAQFVIVAQGASGDQGFEFDNFEDNDDRLPRSAPMISNFTLVGNAGGSGSNDSDQGMLLREGTAGMLYNGIVVNFGDDCLDIDDNSSFDRLAGLGATGAPGDEILDMQSVLLDCPTSNNFDESGSDPTDLSTWFLGRPNNAEITNTLTGTPFWTGQAGLVPGATEQAATATDVNALDSWFAAANYVGAVEDANDTWYEGWTFRPQ